MRACILAASAALLATSALAQIPAEPSTVLVTSPAALQNYFTQNGGIKHNEALFGIPTYGDSVAGTVRIPASTIDGCSPFSADPSWGIAPILMLPRGSCSFETKVFNAEQAGAAAVLIADNLELCYDQNLSPACQTACQNCNQGYIQPTTGCECFLPYMADDHTHSISIPSFLISNNAVNQITDCIAGQGVCDANSNVVLVELRWPLPKPDDRVEWAIWSTATDAIADATRVSFQPLVKPLGSSVQFTGRSFIYDGQDWGCLASYQPCGNQCINMGRYCSPNPDQNVSPGKHGEDVVQENLRQICVFQQANATVATDSGIRYWNYVDLWFKNCQDQSDWKGCSDTQQRAALLDPTVTDTCVSNSQAAGADAQNPLLQAEMQLRENYLILTLPTVVINEQVLRGKPTALSLLQTICNGFATKTPDVCVCTSVSSDWLTVCAEQGIDAVPVSDGGRKGASSGLPGWATGLIVLLVLAVIGVVIGGVIAYRKAHKNMQTMLDDYRRLEAEEHTENDRL